MFEYMVQERNANKGYSNSIEEWVNEFARRGWRLVGVVDLGGDHRYFFERPLAQQKPR